MAKNLCAKTRDKSNPYEVWSNGSWTWRVLKKWQSEEKEATNAYARWYCFVTSPFCPEGEYGDTYCYEIKNNAVRIPADEALAVS